MTFCVFFLLRSWCAFSLAGLEPSPAGRTIAKLHHWQWLQPNIDLHSHHSAIQNWEARCMLFGGQSVHVMALAPDQQTRLTDSQGCLDLVKPAVSYPMDGRALSHWSSLLAEKDIRIHGRTSKDSTDLQVTQPITRQEADHYNITMPSSPRRFSKPCDLQTLGSNLGSNWELSWTQNSGLGGSNCFSCCIPRWQLVTASASVCFYHLEPLCLIIPVLLNGSACNLRRDGRQVVGVSSVVEEPVAGNM